jgi:ankyrin repeat protein
MATNLLDDLEYLKNNVNNVIFNIFDDDVEPNWTPLLKVSTLKKEREENLRYNNIKSNKSKNYDCELAKILIDAGADLNYQDKNGHTALMYCVYFDNINLLKLLIDNGANLNLKNTSGCTALYISGYYKNLDIANILIQSGADVTIKNKDGYTYNDFFEN